MNKIGLTVLGNRIAPVFDVSGTLLVLEIENNSVINKKKEILDAHDINLKFNIMKALGIETLVCGAISRRFQYKAEESGIDLIPFICGNIDDVINSFLSGKPLNIEYSMPGCNCRQGF
jgi:predicted Fe-Mo cluster-binding NifX family protein